MPNAFLLSLFFFFFIHVCLCQFLLLALCFKLFFIMVTNQITLRISKEHNVTFGLTKWDTQRKCCDSSSIFFSIFSVCLPFFFFFRIVRVTCAVMTISKLVVTGRVFRSAVIRAVLRPAQMMVQYSYGISMDNWRAHWKKTRKYLFI